MKTFRDAFTQYLAESLEDDMDLELKPSAKGGKLDSTGESSIEDDISDEMTTLATDPEIDRNFQDQIAKRNKEISGVIRGWVERIEEMSEFLNGTGEESLQSILGRSTPGSLFDKVKANNGRKIANAAIELASLAESLKSFIPVKAIG